MAKDISDKALEQLIRKAAKNDPAFIYCIPGEPIPYFVVQIFRNFYEQIIDGTNAFKIPEFKLSDVTPDMNETDSLLAMGFGFIGYTSDPKLVGVITTADNGSEYDPNKKYKMGSMVLVKKTIWQKLRKVDSDDQ